MRKGTLTFISSVMNSGKTARLLEMDFNYRRIGKKTLLFKSGLDVREKNIKSRNGLEAECLLLNNKEDFKQIKDVDIVLIDEAQFLSKKDIDRLRKISLKMPIDIYCFGLKSDFLGNLFKGSKRLLEVSDHIDELKSMCLCGKKATMHIKYDNLSGKILKKGASIECGYEDRYMSVCYEHWTANNISEIN
jgi:thymidine kinase